MLTHIAYKYRLYPNKVQQLFFAKTFGCCRKVWNLLLNDYNNTGNITTSLVPYKEQYPYLKEIDSLALSQTWNYFTKAIKSWHTIPSRGRPRFKKKNSIQSYTTNYVNNNIRIMGYNPYKKKQRIYIRLPKIGLIKMVLHRPLPYGSIIKHITVTKTLTNEYYISINVEYDNQIDYKILNINNSVGLDYSLHNLIISSNIIDNILNNYENKYKKYQDRLSKYQSLRDKASKNSKKKYKFTMKYRNLHKKIKNQRYDYLHKYSCYLSHRYDYIFIENIDLVSMANKHNKYKLGKSIYDNSFGIFRSLLNYKLIRNGYKYLCVIDKYYPSTQICSYCGYTNTLLHDNISIRQWICPHCGYEHDRDINAAVNIHNRGIILYHKYAKYKSLPIHDNISLNDYILNINKYDIKQHIVLQHIIIQIPKEQKKEIVYQIPKEQRKIHIVNQIKK